MYPKDDQQFQTLGISTVSDESTCYGLGLTNGWSISIPKPSPIFPEPGMSIRLYGRGIGYPVRGIFINAVKVFYRAEEEDKDYRARETYGESAADLVRRWDAGKAIWSISMGGIGPGYEQAIQEAMIEVLRYMAEHSKDFPTAGWQEGKEWYEAKERLYAALATTFENLSGAQAGAAIGLAARFYRDGPVKTMTSASEDRRILVSKPKPSKPEIEIDLSSAQESVMKSIKEAAKAAIKSLCLKSLRDIAQVDPTVTLGDIYDTHPAFREVMNALIDDFEYPDWSHKTLVEIIEQFDTEGRGRES